MKQKLKLFWKMLRRSFVNWNQHDPWANSATIAYYALFSLPSLLIIVLTGTGYFFGREAVQGEITEQFSRFIGESTATALEEMIVNSALNERSTLAMLLGIGVLLFGATTLFFQLKEAMNSIWGVAAKRNTFLRMVMNRVISFGMILVVGLLLLISMTLSAILAFLSDYLVKIIPVLGEVMIGLLNFSVSFLFITALFSAIFKILPDVDLQWKTTIYGAALTSVLFIIGELVLGIYLGKTNPASIYGGASSVVLLLLWVYYNCLILFYGAEFTRQYALYKNADIRPNKYAEPAIYQRLQRLKEKENGLTDKKRILEIIRDDEEAPENEQA